SRSSLSPSADCSHFGRSSGSEDTWSCFFCTPPATTAIYTLSLHDALPILVLDRAGEAVLHQRVVGADVDLRSPLERQVRVLDVVGRERRDGRRAEDVLLRSERQQ